MVRFIIVTTYVNWLAIPFPVYRFWICHNLFELLSLFGLVILHGLDFVWELPRGRPPAAAATAAMRCHGRCAPRSGHHVARPLASSSKTMPWPDVVVTTPMSTQIASFHKTWHVAQKAGLRPQSPSRLPQALFHCPKVWLSKIIWITTAIQPITNCLDCTSSLAGSKTWK